MIEKNPAMTEFPKYLLTNLFNIFPYFCFICWVLLVLNEILYIRNSFLFAKPCVLIKNSHGKKEKKEMKKKKHEEKNIEGVSILKPLKGRTELLEKNLESFFEISYPKFEILFAVAEKNDACLELIEKLMKKYPQVDAKLLVGNDEFGVNPKLNNLIKCYEKEMMKTITLDDSIGVVHQTPVLVNPIGLGGILEWIYFSTQHARIYFLASTIGTTCVNGMSNLFRKSALDRIGGLRKFVDYIAEDYFISISLVQNGYKSVLSRYCCSQNIGNRSFQSFYSRQLRWLRLRK
eukprot:Sdes_comp19167_c0_seq1m9943